MEISVVSQNQLESTWKKGTDIKTLQSNNAIDRYWSINFNEINQDDEIQEEPIRNFTVHDFETYDQIFELNIPNPVYIKKIEGNEQIICNTSIMTPNKIYDIIWNGNMYGVRKTSKGVEVLEFEANGKENE